MGQKRSGMARPAAIRSRSGQSQPRRRRFAGEDTVVVEHQSLGRPAQKRTLNRLSAATEAGQEQERLKQSLQRERRRVHDAEAELASLQDRVRAATTQVTHLRLQVEEGRQTIQQQEGDILRLRAELHQLREEKRKRPASTPRAKAVPAGTEAEAVRPEDKDEAGQEPVQWWKD